MQNQPRRVSVGKRGEAIYQSSSGRFEFPVRVNGKQRWVGCIDADNITQARTFIARYKGVDETERVLPTRITFEQLAAEAFAAATQWAVETRGTHEGNLRNYLAPLHDLKPGQIGASDFVRLVIQPMRRRGLSSGTLASAIQTASVVFRQGVFTKVCPRNPIQDLRKQDRVGVETGHEARVVSSEEFTKILAAVRDGHQYSALHFRVCFGLWGLCGLRLGEALGLQWGDIDFEQGCLTIDRQVTPSGVIGPPKTKASAGRVDLPSILAAQLKELKRQRPTIDPHAYVLAGANGPWPARTTASQALEKTCKRAGILGDLPTPHDLRHSFGSALMSRCGNDGIDIAYVSRQMRHENVTITLNTYTHEWDALQKPGRAGAVIDSIFAGAFG